jgi:hypothetical protein
MDTKAGLDPLEKMKVTCHCGEWNHGSSAVSVPTKLSQIMTSYFITVTFFPFTAKSSKWYLSFRLSG